MRQFKDLQDIKRFCVEVADLLDKPSPVSTGTPQEIHELVNYSMELKNVSGTMAVCYAAISKYLAEQKGILMEDIREQHPKLNFMERKEIVDSLLADEKATLLLAQRLESRISGIMDMIRSVISMYKSELNVHL